jgi:hypothetical protein
MLIQELGTPVVEGYTDDNDVMLEHQYHGKLMPAINKTTLDSEVTVGVQVDMALKIGYSHKCIIGDFGYNLWARSEEHVVCRERFSKNCFGIKGDGQVYGFTLQGDNFVGLNATQQFATIHAGQPDGSASNQFANDNADNKVLTRFLGDELQQSKAPFTATGITAAEQVSGSQESVFISDCDLDNAGAMTPMGISHTLFATIGYRWQDADPVEPYLLVGGEIEYDGTSRRRRSALSQWGVWLEAGFVY